MKVKKIQVSRYIEKYNKKGCGKSSTPLNIIYLPISSGELDEGGQAQPSQG